MSSISRSRLLLFSSRLFTSPLVPASCSSAMADDSKKLIYLRAFATTSSTTTPTSSSTSALTSYSYHDFSSISQLLPNSPPFGKYNMISSTSDESREYFDFSATYDVNSKHLSDMAAQNVWIRGRVHSVRAKGKAVFVILRKGTLTFQICYFKDKSKP